MRWRNVIVPLLIVAVSVAATAALAITPVTNTERSATRQQIAQQLGPSHSYALLIGISDFDNAGWHHLAGVGPEIDKVSAALHDQGFTIVPESHTGRMDHATLKSAIEHFFQTYGQKAEDRLVVYVATHGYSDPSRPNADGFLVASDAGVPAQGSVPNGYSVHELSAALTSIAAQHVFLFFDSCFSGAMLPEPTRANDTILAGKPVLALSKETAAWTLDLLAHNARLVLTAGNASQSVPDVDNPFAAAVVDALNGAADTDGDGLILGTEIAQFVRGRVARATRLAGHANDPVFAVLPKLVPPVDPRPDVADPGRIDYALQGDFIFLAPGGPKPAAEAGISEQQALLTEKQSRLSSGQFLACVDCPTMVKLPGDPALALASTEITYGQWDACYRQMGCHRYLADDGFGRGDRPASNMTWLDALEYVTWLSSKSSVDQPCPDYRLPTADEWISAATYGTAGPVTWASAVADGQPVCWGCGAGEDGNAAMRAASQPANAAGLYDMVGNLWEWAADGADSAAPTCNLTAIRQAGQCGPGRVMGGSFATRADALASIETGGTAPRTGNDRPWSSPTIGLRVACDVKPS
ncbi:MAG: SUMF1/EgtB/PvdO family nonheme iron enzyme [Devosia sp.]